MTISNQLFLSILAMDAYNRGYGEGRLSVLGINQAPGSVGEELSNASIILESDVDEDTPGVNNGFYAAAYQVGNDIVIAYRGTDDLADAFNDLQLIISEAGLGSAGNIPEQAFLASEFYNTIRAANPDANITLTGHSLGGALAGYVGSVHNVDAVLFNNISFKAIAETVREVALINDQQIEESEQAAEDTGTTSNLRAIRSEVRERVYQLNEEGIVDDLTTDDLPALYTSNLVSRVIDGDVAENTRIFQNQVPIDNIGSQSRSENLEAVPSDLFGIPVPILSGTLFGVPGFLLGQVGSREINLHWQSFVVIKLYSEEFGQDALWSNVYNETVTALYSNEVAEAAGVVSGKLGEEQGDFSLLQKIIAYSALDEGLLPYGDTAIRAMFNDFSDLGIIYSAGQDNIRNTFFDSDINDAILFDTSVRQALANIAVQYAGALASNAVIGVNVDVELNLDILQGVFDRNDDNSVFAIDFSSVLWRDALQIGNDQPVADLDVIGRDELVEAYVSSQEFDIVTFPSLLNRLAQDVFNAGNADIFDRYHINIVDPSSTDLMGEDTIEFSLSERNYDVGISSGTHVDVFIAQQEVLSESGQFIGNNVTGTSGNDLIIGGSGDDELRGGEGIDALIGGLGSDTLIGGEGADYLDGGDNDDPNSNDIDLASYEGSDQFIRVNLEEDTFTGTEIEQDTLISIEGFIGSDVNDELIGDDGDNIFFGGDGADILQGGEGADELYGGDGDDIFINSDQRSVLIVEGQSDGLRTEVNARGAAEVDDLVSDRLEGGKGADVYHIDYSFRAEERLAFEGDELRQGLEEVVDIIRDPDADMLGSAITFITTARPSSTGSSGNARVLLSNEPSVYSFFERTLTDSDESVLDVEVIGHAPWNRSGDRWFLTFFNRAFDVGVLDGLIIPGRAASLSIRPYEWTEIEERFNPETAMIEEVEVEHAGIIITNDNFSSTFDSTAIVIIENFRNGDFGINLEGLGDRELIGIEEEEPEENWHDEGKDHEVDDHHDNWFNGEISGPENPGGQIVVGNSDNNILDGGLGNDGFVFAPGSGQDRIVASTDSLITNDQLFLDYTIDQLIVRQSEDLNNIEIFVIEERTDDEGQVSRTLSADTLIIEDQFSAETIDTFIFNDGVQLNPEEFADLIRPSEASFRFIDADLANVTFVREAVEGVLDAGFGDRVTSYDLVILENDIEVARVFGQFDAIRSGSVGNSGFDNLIFNSSEILSRTELANMIPLIGTDDNDGELQDILSPIFGGAGGSFELFGSNQSELIQGLAGDDVIVGNAGNDIIDGGIGNDLLIGDFAFNGIELSSSAELFGLNIETVGSDTFIYRSGDGNDVIIDSGLGSLDIDRLVLTDLNLDQVEFTRVNTNVLEIEIEDQAPAEVDPVTSALIIIDLITRQEIQLGENY